MSTRHAATAVPLPIRPWMSMTLAFMLVVGLFSSTLLTSTASAQGTSNDLASAVPADTVMFMGLNLDQDSDQWTQTRDLLERAGLSDLAEDQAGTSTDELADSAEAQGITGYAAMVFTDADSLMSYSTTQDLTNAAMDTTMDPTAGEVPEVPGGFAMVIQPDDPQAMAEQFVTMATNEAETNGATLQTVDYNGVTITYWEPSAESTQVGTATAEVDGTVILATRVSDVEPIIDTVQGTTENLADTDGFKSVVDALPADHISFGYMNMEVLMDSMAQSPEFAGTVSAEDIEAAKGHMGWVVYASNDGFHFDTATILNDPSQLEAMSGFTPSMAEKFPADLMLFANGNNIAGSGIIEMIAGLIQTGMSQPAPTAQAYEPAGMGTPAPETTTVASPSATPTEEEVWAMLEQQLGFNPNTELLALLDGEFASAAGVYGLDEGMPYPGFLFVSESSDPATLTQTTDVITNIANQTAQDGTYTVSSRAIGSDEVTVITIDSSQTGNIPVVIEFGIVNDSMVIGTPEMIDEYAGGSGPKLADDASFTDTFSKLPSENVYSISYMNIEGQLLPLLDFVVTMMNTSTTTLDNHADCGEYATQAEAQEAYEADPSGLWVLDQDFDDEACEDFFGEATAVASPESVSSQVNIQSAGSVTWIDGDIVRTNSIVVIGE